MKYKPGDLVVVTKVPAKAERFVAVGMSATILELDEAYVDWAEEAGLTVIRVGFFTFWWAEDDLGLHQ